MRNEIKFMFCKVTWATWGNGVKAEGMDAGVPANNCQSYQKMMNIILIKIMLVKNIVNGRILEIPKKV